MSRSVRLAALLIILAIAPTFPGCLAEVDDPDRGLAISGTVTYHGSPVKQGVIRFLPATARGLPASGTIADGLIKDVYTQTQGDGIKAGKYRIAISAFDQEFLDSMTGRDFNGPEPQDVARAVNNLKPSIPLRYSNARESGLVEEISPNHREIRIELVD